MLAGFMRVLGEEMLGAFPGRIINIHPALLPAFAGVHAQRQALRGRREGRPAAPSTSSTQGVDTGPIIAQAAVLVHEDDDEESLRARILAEEHRLLPAVVRAIAERRVVIEDRRVRILGGGPSGENSAVLTWTLRVPDLLDRRAASRRAWTHELL